MEQPALGGTFDARFEPVAEAFALNLAERGETGAAVCVTVDGRAVVDVVGGFADEAGTVPWRHDTLVNAFSVGKGVTSMLVARLVGTGILGWDERVAAVWPDFAAEGKGELTLRQLLAHRAGLPSLRERVAPGTMLDWDAMTTALAAEAPWWEPGTAHGYHVNTWGFLVGEVVRRHTGRSVGELLRDEVAGPLGADVWLGLPASEHNRVAETVWPGEMPDDVTPPGLEGHELMRYQAYFNPVDVSGAGSVNTAAWREAEIPSTNLHASARGVARLYAAMAAGGRIDGVEVVDPGALADAVVEQSAGEDLVLGRPSRFGCGFQLTQPERPLGPNPRAFGHFGAGGSLGFCDPEAGIAFGYVMSRLGARWQSERNVALVDAVYESLG